MNKEQLLEKMLANVRAGFNANAGIQIKLNDEWENSQSRFIGDCLLGTLEFRLAPRTRNICGFDVPAPEVDEPEDGVFCYHLSPWKEDGIICCKWRGSITDRNALRNGIWLSGADAIANAKALRGENPYE